jgi:tRNA A58 N-methylase Trm61
MQFLNPQIVIPHFDIAEGMHVADFGSGAGFFTHLLAEKVGPYGIVYAVDNNHDLILKVINEGKAKGVGHIKGIKADLSSNSDTLSPQSVDRVILANTFSGTEDKSTLLSHAYNFLKPGGKIIMIDLKGHEISQDQASSIVGCAGFVREKEFNAGDYHYGMVFKKM